MEERAKIFAKNKLKIIAQNPTKKQEQFYLPIFEAEYKSAKAFTDYTATISNCLLDFEQYLKKELEI